MVAAEAKAVEARTPAPPALGRPRLPTWFLLVIAAVLVAARLTFSFIVPPNMDEAYYFAWGQHLQLSYFDHAPLQGWMQGLSASLFGFTTLGLRAMNQLTLAGSAWIFWAWASRLAPDDRVNAFWTIFTVYLASPIVFGISLLSYPDHWLMFLSLASMHFFALFLGERLEERPGDVRYLYAGAALLGLAALAKYNAVTLGVAVAAAIVLHPRLRPLLRNVHLYLAAVVSVAMLTPVLVWNATNEFASLRFQLVDRFGPGGPGGAQLWGEFSAERFLAFAVLLLVFASVALALPMVWFYRRPAGSGFRGALVLLGKWGFAMAVLPIAAVSFFTRGAPHWTMVGIVAFVPLAAFYFRWRWLLTVHLLLGTAVMTLVSVYFASYPTFSSAVPGDREAPSYYGYDQVADRMLELRDEHGAVGLASLRYDSASKLAFGAGPGVFVTSLAPAHDAFDDWRDEAALTGKDFIIHDEWNSIGQVEAQFDSVTLLDEITPTRFGQPLIRYRLYLGEGYKGLAVAAAGGE